MSEPVKLTNQDWLTTAETRSVLAAIGEGRFVGGCVRNALLGVAVADVDIATPLLPDEVMRRLEAAGIRVIGTGLEHGTVTAVTNKRVFEITTLRRDVATDGRRATVAYTDSWAEDASRRDFTMNALYADASGAVFDATGSGLADLKAARVRFIGDAATRIKEDYLRILRLFRFHAWYGKGEIDGTALQASAAASSHIKGLSGERIQKEMLRLLEAENPLAVLRTMAASAILGEVLSGALDFERLQRLCEVDDNNFFAADSLLRLAALVTSDAQASAIALRWRLSNDDRDRLRHMASSTTKIVSYLSVPELQRTLYRQGQQRVRDLVRLRWAEDTKASNGIQWRALLAIVDSWTRPVFPLTGRDVMHAGVPEGPLVGRVKDEVEQWWIDSNFTDDPFSIAERLKAVAQALG